MPLPLRTYTLHGFCPALPLPQRLVPDQGTCTSSSIELSCAQQFTVRPTMNERHSRAKWCHMDHRPFTPGSQERNGSRKCTGTLRCLPGICCRCRGQRCRVLRRRQSHGPHRERAARERARGSAFWPLRICGATWPGPCTSRRAGAHNRRLPTKLPASRPALGAHRFASGKGRGGDFSNY